MNKEQITARLSQFSPEARQLAEAALREEGLLAQDAPLEDAFPTTPSTRDEACCDACDKSFDSTMESCETDACKAGAALKYAKCLKKCGYYD